MQLPIYQVDAFANAIFRGNPAAIVPLAAWLPDSLLQDIAAENNLAETAYYVPDGEDYHIRWFTPELEMDLCGHATLAAAHVLWEHYGFAGEALTFRSASGPLRVSKNGPWLTLDFPSRPPQPAAAPLGLLAAIGGKPVQVLNARDFVLVYDSPAEVLALNPDPAALQHFDLGTGGIIATAAGDGSEGVDFVSRFFTPGASVFEDPVTGSAHCSLIPYWAAQLGKTELTARQVSPRGGELRCRLRGERVDISGRAITYLQGHIQLP